MITKREAAIISAYTGYMLGDFSEMHALIEEVLERPVFTHELGNQELCKEIHEKTKPLFCALEVEE